MGASKKGLKASRKGEIVVLGLLDGGGVDAIAGFLFMCGTAFGSPQTLIFDKKGPTFERNDGNGSSYRVLLNSKLSVPLVKKSYGFDNFHSFISSSAESPNIT